MSAIQKIMEQVKTTNGVLRFSNIPDAEFALNRRSNQGTSAWCLIRIPDKKTPFVGIRYIDLRPGGLKKLIDFGEYPLLYVFNHGRRAFRHKDRT